MAHRIIKREILKPANISISLVKTQREYKYRYRVNQVDIDSNMNIETRFYPENMYIKANNYYNKLTNY